MTDKTFEETWDIAIIGGGPAGLAAAVNGAIRNKKVLLLEHQELCHKIILAEKIDNYLGLPSMTGREMVSAFTEHFRLFDIPVLPRRAEIIAGMGDIFMISVGTDDVRARTVILTTGVVSRKSLPGEEAFAGRGVSYCATCDGPLYRGRDVAVLAYSAEAVEEANFLAEICRKVYLIKAIPELQGLKSEVEVLEGKPLRINGDDFVTSVTLEHGDIPVEGVFIVRPNVPLQRLLSGLEMEDGFIRVDRALATSVKGVWAAGDCTGRPLQIAKAVGEGATAALNAVKYLDTL